MKSLLLIIVVWLLQSYVSANDIDDDDDSKDVMCKTHDSCSSVFSLNIYCCRTSCCNWFQFLYFYAKQDRDDSDAIPFKGPSILTIVLLAILGLISIIFVCCIICSCCLCRKCCCKNNNKTSKSTRNRGIVLSSNHNVRSTVINNRGGYMPVQSASRPPLPTSPIPTNTYHQLTNTTTTVAPLASITSSTVTVQPSAPLEEPLLAQYTIEPSAPPEIDNYDKPPAYDDLVKSGEVTIININATTTTTTTNTSSAAQRRN